MANNETPLKEPPYIRYFSLILIFLGCLGGFLALTVPLWKSLSNIPVVGPVLGFLSLLIPASDTDNKYPESKAIADLRLHILYITGGIIAILTLLQTSWKNQVDRRKVEADIQKNEQDAKNEATKREQDAIKSERDHTRQVYAERRSRYTKAVEQLANEKSAIRLGGVYTLVGLADEWLTDKDPKSKEQQKEGQVIINNLCAYIRSPYEFTTGQDTAREREVRKTIFNEISIRTKPDSKKDKTNWSDLLFEFQGAVFFYELDLQDMEFKKNVDFSGAKFFYSAKFKNINFKGGVKFTSTKFSTHENHLTSFSDCSFQNSNSFERAEFNGEVQFSDTHFNSVGFGESRFFQKASFSNFTSNETPSFTDALFTIYESHYFGFNYTSPDAIIPLGDSPLAFPVYPMEFKNNSQEIPKYSRLFDPKSKNQETGDYDKSERAQ